MATSENIDILSYTYGVRFLLEAGIIGYTTDEILKYIEERKEFDINGITQILGNYSNYLMDSEKLARHKHLFYSYRQELIKRKQLILDDQAFMTKEVANSKKAEVVSYKVGQNADGIRPSNDFERKALLESRLSEFQMIITTLDNHITFLLESLKNITDMIYGIQFVLQLEDYRKNY